MEGDEEQGSPELAEQERADLLHAQDLLRVIDFGFQVQQFIDGAVCRRMEADADREILELMHALVGVDGDTEEGRIEERRMRMRIAVLNQWKVFLENYVTAGKAAEVEFHEGERPADPVR